MARLSTLLVVLLLALLHAATAQAFCGFYVDTGGASLTNGATQVVLMRAGTRTVLSMSNEYKGPLESFALVVPVPIVLERANVRTLPEGVFARVERLASPRLVEYWEQDPCPPEVDYDSNKEGGTGARARGEEGSMGDVAKRPAVKVEAEFNVDEYDVVVLSATDALALETWLRDNHYVIPSGAAPLLRPYVLAGSKFFVAKVDARKVRFRWGRAQLSPLRFFYDTPDFALPIRLGLINSSGVQDLVVHTLGAQRYEVANYENLFIPTNLSLKREVRDRFATFYAALFDRTVAGHPRSVVTEYAWAPTSCDPCPAGAGPLSREDLALLGTDVIPTPPATFVLTRLHARYGKDSLGEDLIFRGAPPIEGGRQSSGSGGELSQTPSPASSDNFQARYILHHPWTGPVTCGWPRFGVWGGPPGADAMPRPPGALATLVRRDMSVEEAIEDPARLQHAAPTPGGARSFWTFGQYHWRWAHQLSDRIVMDQTLDEEIPCALAAMGALLAALLGRRRRSTWATLGLFVALGLAQLALAGVAARLLDHGSLSLERVLERVVHHARYFWPTVALLAGACLVAARRPRPNTESASSDPVLIGAALLPAVAGLLRAHLLVRRVMNDPDYTTLPDLGTWTRVVGSMGEELLAPVVVGCVQSALLLVVTGWMVARSAEHVLARRAPARTLLLLAAAGLLVAMAARVVLIRLEMDDGMWVDPLVLLALVSCLALVLLTTPEAGWHLLVAAGCAVTAVLLLDLAARAAAQAGGLGAVAGGSLDASQVRRLLVATHGAERARALVTVVDMAALTAPVALALRRARPFHTERRALARSVAAGVNLTAVAVMAATVMVWSGELRRIADLDSGSAHLRLDGPPPRPAVGAHPAHGLDGPALVLAAGGRLLATPGPGVAARPYDPTLLDELAQAAASTEGAPILVADPALDLAGVLQGLAPMVAMQQLDFRLLELLSARSVAPLGPYAPIALARDSASPVQLQPAVAFEKGEASEPSTLGLLQDGDGFRLAVLARDAGDAQRYRVTAAPMPARFTLEGMGAVLADLVAHRTHFTEAVVAFDPHAGVPLLARMAIALREPFRSAGLPVFQRVVFTPSREALARTMN